jgi:hypothetical protein
MATPKAKPDTTFWDQAAAFRANPKAAPVVNSQTSNPNLKPVAPTGKLNDTMGMVPGQEPIRKTVAQPPATVYSDEPKPPQNATPTPGPDAPKGKTNPSGSHAPHASPTARRHANRHARFNRTITDPTLKAWAEAAKAAALAARTKYETDNPRPKSAATDAAIGAHGKRRNGS